MQKGEGVEDLLPNIYSCFSIRDFRGKVVWNTHSYYDWYSRNYIQWIVICCHIFTKEVIFDIGTDIIRKYERDNQTNVCTDSSYTSKYIVSDSIRQKVVYMYKESYVNDCGSPIFFF